MSSKRTMTIKAFEEYLDKEEETGNYIMDPSEFYDNVLAVKRYARTHRRTLKTMPSKIRLNEAMDELRDRIDEKLNFLEEMGYPIPEAMSPETSPETSPLRSVKAKKVYINSSNSNASARKTKKKAINEAANISPNTLAAIKAANKTYAKHGLNISPNTLAAIAAMEQKTKNRSASPATKAAIAAMEQKSKPRSVSPTTKAAIAAMEKKSARFSNSESNNESSRSARSPLIKAISPASCSKLRYDFIEDWVKGYIVRPEIQALIQRFKGFPLKPTRLETIDPAFDKDFEIKETVGDGTCLIHAFLTDLSPTYRSFSEDVQGPIGRAFRKDVYAKLRLANEPMAIEFPDYQTVKGIPSVKAATKKDAGGATIYTADARHYIQDSGGYLYDTDVDFLMECFGIRVIVLTKSAVKYDRIRLKGEVDPKDLAREHAVEVAANIPPEKHVHFIMIYQRGGHYEAVRRKGREQYVFTYDEMKDVIEAAVQPPVKVTAAAFTVGTSVTLYDGTQGIIHADERKGWFPPFPDAPYVLIGIWLVDGKGKRLHDLTEIIEVSGAAFDPLESVIKRFQPTVPVTLLSGKRLTVDAKGLVLVKNRASKRRRPVGVWLTDKGAPELYDLGSIQAVDGDPFEAGQYKAGSAVTSATHTATLNSPQTKKKKVLKRKTRKN